MNNTGLREIHLILVSKILKKWERQRGIRFQNQLQPKMREHWGRPTIQGGGDVAAFLEKVAAFCGKPLRINVDIGPEFISKELG